MTDLSYVLLGLVLNSVVFFVVNIRCLAPEEGRKPHAILHGVLLFFLSPFFYIIVFETLYDMIVFALSGMLSRVPDGIDYCIRIGVALVCFMIPMPCFLHGYSRLAGRRKRLSYFIFVMSWIINLNARLIADSRVAFYPLVLAVLTSIWYWLFRNDIRLMDDIELPGIAHINRILTFAYFANLILMAGIKIRLRFTSAVDVSIMSFWLALVGIVTFGLMMFFFHVLFSLFQEQWKTLEDAREKERLSQDVRASQEEIILSLAEIVEAKSGQTGNHIKRVSEYTACIATVLGYSPREVNRIRIASMLHDLGKLMIPNDILEKPGKLTPEEFSVVKTHTTQGDELLKRCTGRTLKLARTIAVEHHERWDGKGYPRGLKGEEISEASQIASVADVFDALSSKRCYKEAWDDGRAKAEIDACSGSQFSPAIVAAFDKAYPEIERSHASYQDDEV